MGMRVHALHAGVEGMVYYYSMIYAIHMDLSSSGGARSELEVGALPHLAYNQNQPKAPHLASREIQQYKEKREENIRTTCYVTTPCSRTCHTCVRLAIFHLARSAGLTKAWGMTWYISRGSSCLLLKAFTRKNLKITFSIGVNRASEVNDCGGIWNVGYFALFLLTVSLHCLRLSAFWDALGHFFFMILSTEESPILQKKNENSIQPNLRMNTEYPRFSVPMYWPLSVVESLAWCGSCARNVSV